MMAPLIENALWRLQAALSTLYAADGTITIDDFYADVRAPSAAELDALGTLPWDGADLLRASGQDRFVGGVTGMDALVKLYLMPCCNLTGIEGGYVQPMRKSVVPNFGAAELNFRTVPDQSGEQLLHLVRRHLERRDFDDLSAELLSETAWFRCSPTGPRCSGTWPGDTDSLWR